MFAFAPSMCLFCDCSLVCELQADVVQFSSICVYGVNIRCIWIFYFFPSFHLSVKDNFSSFFIWNISRSASPSAVRWRKAPLSVFQSVEKPVCGKGGRISLYSAPEYNQVLFPVCFLSYAFDFVISLEGEMFSHFCLSAVVILNIFFFTWTILVSVFYRKFYNLVSRLNSVKSFSFQWIFKSMNLYVMNFFETSRLPWCSHVHKKQILFQWVSELLIWLIQSDLWMNHLDSHSLGKSENIRESQKCDFQD